MAKGPISNERLKVIQVLYVLAAVVTILLGIAGLVELVLRLLG